MTGESLYKGLLLGIFCASAVTFGLLVAIKAPYGRYVRKGWGPTIPAKIAWVVMEAPVVFIILALYVGSPNKSFSATFFFVLWQTHYLYRTFLYPMLMRGGRKAFPVVLVLMALVFNSANGYVNGWYLYSSGWLVVPDSAVHPRYIVGGAMFLAGLYVHIRSDHILRHLRSPGETAYKVPMGGMYRFLSAPNYFGEILQWCGWAVLTWSLAGVAFAVFTIANLLPRGLSHHRWYKETFPEYPHRRKAVIPFVL